LKDFIINKIKSNDITYLKVILNDNDYLGRIIISLILQQKLIYRCGAGKYKLSIAANGDMYPCDSFVGNTKYIMGNILNDNIPATPSNIFFEASIFNRISCSDCWNRYLCGGDCYYNSMLTTGSIFNVDPIICLLKKALSEIAIEIVYELSRHTNLLDYLSRFVFLRRNYKMQGENNNVTKIN